MRNINMLRILSFFIALIFLSSCSESTSQQQIEQVVAIENSDECHLCGMLIVNFSGPKGQLYQNELTKEQTNRAKKFCSTRDMFSYYLDPEHTHNISSMWVHDMSKSPWKRPNDDFFIDARSAWYVVNSTQTGAMGKTLASFSTKHDADLFAKKYNGKVISFQQITLDQL